MKIKNMYINGLVEGGLVVEDCLADQELLRVNGIKFLKTYDIKEELKRYGFKFNPYNKKSAEWVLEGASKEDEDKILEELRGKYLVERDSGDIMHKKQCFLCGSYYYTVCDCERFCK